MIDEKTMIIAFAEVSGRSITGENCWLGVGCSTMQPISIGADCVIDIGDVILKDAPSRALMVGDPAKILRTKNK